MASNPITSLCSDTTEALSFNAEMSLYLKPIAKVHISVQLPQMKSGGKSISNWEVMEKLKSMVKPDKFMILKVIKSALEFIRLEGETESKSSLPKLLAKLDGTTMKLSGYPEVLKVRAVEAKSAFPSRHDWDSYFRDAKNMNEMKPGERPDTVHISEVPCKWFMEKHLNSKSSSSSGKPSQRVIEDVFSQYGEIRHLDVPILDPYREELMLPTASSTAVGINTFKFGQDLVFDAYVQYKEYMCFVKCMEALRGMKLMHVNSEGKAYTANFKVDFDKTKHLTDKAIKKRELEARKIKALLLEKERKIQAEREYEENKKKEMERKAREEKEEKTRRKRERERKRKQKIDEKQRIEDERKLALNIAKEERKILVAQRKLESIRLLTELIDRVKKQKTAEDVERRERELVEEQKRLTEEKIRREQEAKKRKIEEKKREKDESERKERELREKILNVMKEKEERRLAEEREALRRRLSGQVRLKSAIVMKKYLGGRPPHR